MFVDENVGGRYFGDVFILVSDARSCAGLSLIRLSICQIIVHAAATLKFRWPAISGYLSMVADL